MSATLKAGRELDLLVAEKVMGWRHIGQWTGDEPPDDSDWVGVPPGQICVAFVPFYSTGIAAAWLVAEEMRRRGYSVLICFDEQPADKWEAEFTRTDEDDREYHGWVFNESAPLAICQAALAAMEPKATDR